MPAGTPSESPDTPTCHGHSFHGGVRGPSYDCLRFVYTAVPRCVEGTASGSPTIGMSAHTGVRRCLCRFSNTPSALGRDHSVAGPGPAPRAHAAVGRECKGSVTGKCHPPPGPRKRIFANFSYPKIRTRPFHFRSSFFEATARPADIGFHCACVRLSVFA